MMFSWAFGVLTASMANFELPANHSTCPVTTSSAET